MRQNIKRATIRQRLLADSAKKPEWVVRNEPVPEQSVFEELVLPGHKIVYVGAYGHFENDPVPLALTQMAGSKKVTIVDCHDWLKREDGSTLSERMKEAQEKLEALGRKAPQLKQKMQVLSTSDGLATGSGGLTSYRQDVQQLQKRGYFPDVELKTAIKLAPGLAWNTGLRAESASLVVDRGTSGYIISQGRGKLFKTFNHYTSLLKPGGKIVFLTYGKGLSMIESKQLRRILETARRKGLIHVEEVPIQTNFPHNYYDICGDTWRPDNAYSLALIVTKLRTTTTKKT